MKLTRFGFALIFLACIVGIWIWRRHGLPQIDQPASAPVVNKTVAAAAAPRVDVDLPTTAPTAQRGIPPVPVDQVFGLNGPVKLSDVPSGRFLDELRAAAPAARERALEALGRLRVPIVDVPHLHLGRRGDIFYACLMQSLEESSGAVTANPPSALTVATPVPVTTPPVRHSRPGSSNVVYLDFNGHTVTGTRWNDSFGVPQFVCQPYDTDGDAATFSDTEQAAIIEIWRRVAEDFSPFDVDVTTEEPVNFTQRTLRALITHSEDANGVTNPSGLGVSGVAFLSVFNTSETAWSSPAFIYANRLASPASVAEVVSHELGHNFGLSHDGFGVYYSPDSYSEYYAGHGTGENSWAPIMGASYGKTVTQWSKGEYYGANNLQDDLTIIGGALAYRTDVAGSSLVAATPIPSVGELADTLTTAAKSHFFSISAGAGPVSFTATPVEAGNADLRMELLDVVGNVLASSDPADSRAVTLAPAQPVAAGAYFLRVSAAGVGTPEVNSPSGYTAYGSVGQFKVTASVVAAVPVFTSPSAATVGVGHELRYVIAVGGTAYGFGATGLPDGLTVDSANGLISGRPTTVGTFAVVLTATNAAGTGTAPLTLTVTAAPPVVSAATATSFVLAPGDTAALGVTAFSVNGAVRYQWMRNGRPVAEATSANLTATSRPDAGYDAYWVEATNDIGVARSAPFFVRTAPTFTRVQAWGISNSYGQTTVPAGLGRVVDVAAGANNSMALSADGRVSAWGAYTALPPTGTGAVAVATGTNVNAVLRADGSVGLVPSNESQTDTPAISDANRLAAMRDAVAIAAGNSHLLVLKTNGNVVGWRSYYASTTSTPEIVPENLTDVVAIAASGNRSLALKSDGTVFSWGSDADSQPVALTGVTSMSTGSSRVLVLKSGGTTVAWGGGSASPTLLPDGSALAVGEMGSYALKPDGTISVWGTSSAAALPPASLQPVRQLRVGALHALVLVDAAAESAPTITTPPADALRALGGTHTFTVAATGPGVLSYQWRKNGTPITGASSSAYRINALQASHAGSYDVVVSNHIGSVTSAAANLTVEAPPAIGTAPASSINATLGTQLVLSAVATSANGPLTYQWKKNNRVLPGATNATLTIPAFSPADAGAYVLEVTDVHGFVSRTLSFIRPDYGPTQVRVWGQSYYNVNTVPADLPADVVAVTVVEGMAVAVRANGQLAVWGDYATARIRDQLATISDAVALAAWDSTLLILRANGQLLALTVNGVLNTQLAAEVVGIAGNYGLAAAVLADGTVRVWGSYGVPTIPADLTGVSTVAAGSSHILALKVDGTVTAFGSNYYGESTVPAGLTDVVAVAAGGNYSVALKSDGTVVTWGAAASANSPKPTDIEPASAIFAGYYATALRSDGTMRFWANTDTSLSQIAPPATGIVALGGGFRNPAYIRSVAGDAAPAITRQPTAIATLSGVPQRFSVAAAGLPPLRYQWRKNGTPLADRTQANLDILDPQPADAANYDVVVSNHIGSVTSAVATLTLVTPPTITNPPPHRFLANRGQSIQLTVAASSPFSPLAYQWKKNNRPLSGATTATYAIPSFSATDAGAYTVEVTDSRGAVSRATTFVVADVGPTQVLSWAQYGDALPPGDLANVYALRYYNTAILRTGELVGWAYNGYVATSLPASSLPIVDAVREATSYESPDSWIALRADGRVVGSTTASTSRYAANIPANLRDVIALAPIANSSGVYALGADGRVYTWSGSATLTVLDTGDVAVSALSSGNGFTALLRVDGTVAMIGTANNAGQLNVPAGLTDVTALATGSYHTLALKSDGTVVAWGSNSSRQCSVPADLSDVVAISAISDLSYAVKADGTLVRWGGNSYSAVTAPAAYQPVLAFSPANVLRAASADSAPVIVTQPTGGGLRSVGDTLTLSVAATGSSALSYQWRRDGVALSGATAATFTISSLQLTDAGTYDIVVSNHIGRVVSQGVALQVAAPPVLSTTSAARQIAPLGAPLSVTFTATSSYGPFTYQWKKNNRPLVGATTATLSLPLVTRADAGAYTLEATDNRGLVARSTIFVLPADSGLVRVWGDNNYGQTNLPAVLNTGVLSIAAGHYSNWALLVDGTVAGWGQFSTYTSSARVPAGLTDVVALAANAGYAYALRADGTVRYWNSSFDSTLSGSFRDIVSLVASSACVAGLRSDGSVVINTSGGASSASVTLPATDGPFVDVAAGEGHVLALRLDGTVVGWTRSTSDYSYAAAAKVPAGLTGVVSIAAGGNRSFALCSDGSVVSWGADANLQAIGSGGAKAIAAGPGGAGALLADDTLAAWSSSSAALRAVPANLGSVRQFAFGNQHGIALVAGTINGTAPSITRAPLALTRAPGDAATFDVVATGTSPLNYQWRKDGVALPGVTSATLALGPLTVDDAASYDVVISNIFGSVTSAAAALTVDAGPQITTAPAARTVVMLGDSVTLTAAATSGYAPLTYQWKKNNRPLAGETAPTLTLAALTAAQTGAYTLEVTDARGAVSRATSFVLATYPRPQVLLYGDAGSYSYTTPPRDFGANAVAASLASDAVQVTRADGTVAVWAPGSSSPQVFVAPSITDAVSAVGNSTRYFVLRSNGTVWTGEGPTNAPVQLVGLENVVALAPGYNSVLALRSNGTLAEYGYNYVNGEYVYLASFASSAFKLVGAPLRDVVGIATYPDYATAAVRLDGSVVAWSSNSSAPATVTGAPSASGVTQVALGYDAGIGVRTDGFLTAWGSTSSSLRALPPAGNVLQVAAGYSHALALRADGTVAVWGTNSYGTTQISGGLNGIYAIAARNNRNLILRDTTGDAVPTIATPPANLTLGVGSSATFTVAAAGPVPYYYQWRKNGQPITGATGATLVVPAITSVDVGSYDVVVSNHAGSVTSVAATLSLTSVPAGGDGSFSSFPAHRQVVAPGAPLTLTHTLASPLSGATYRWYFNNRLIAGATQLSYTIPAVTAQTAGAYTLAVTGADGTTVRNTTFVLPTPTPSYLRAWGSNNYGQLNFPSDLGDIIAVAAGSEHALALRADGTVRAWGGNSYNQRTVPAELSEVVAIAAGSYHCLALRADGTVVAWGNAAGTVPIGLRDVIAIAADGYRSIALKSDGTVKVWGDSSAVSPPADAVDLVAVAVGNYHAVALKSDGTAIAWSYTSNNSAAVVPAGLTDVVAIVASGYQSAARTRTGRLVVWGSQANAVALGETPVSLVELGSLYGLVRTTAGDWLSWGDTSTGTRNIPTDLGPVLALSASDYFALALCDATGHAAPTITAQPADKLAAAGDRVVFSVTASGPGTLTYQWRLNGTAISGATSASLTLNDVGSGQAGSYDVVVTNHVGSAASRVAVLTLGQSPAFTTRPATRSLVAVGQSLTLTGASTTDYGPVAYRWKKNNRPIAGATSATLTLANFADSDAGAYTLEATDSRGLTARSTSFVLPDYGRTEIVAFGESDRVAMRPSDVQDAIAVSSGFNFDSALRADGSVRVWGGFTSSRPTPTALNDIVALAAGSSHLWALRANGTVVGWGSSYTTLASPPAYARDVVAITTDNSATTIIRADGAMLSWRNSDASPMALPDISEEVSTVSTNGDSTRFAVTASGAVVAWGTNANGITTLPANLTSVSSVAAGNYAAVALKGDGSLVAWGNNYFGLTNPPSGTFLQVAGAGSRAGGVARDGTLAFWGYDSGNGSNTPPSQTGNFVALTISPYLSLALRRSAGDAQPAISTQPVSGTATRGGNFTLSVVATSTRPLSYQWRRNGTAITGATAATLTLTDVQDSAAGSYDVIVSNSAGSVTSVAATVTVGVPPVITTAPAVRQLVALGTSRTLTFAASTTHAPLSYRWKKNNRIIADASTASLTLANFTAADAGAYTLEITDALGLVTRATTFVLPDYGRTLIRVWGSNSSNQLNVPTNISDAIAVSAGGTHSLALRADGTVSAWGSNSYSATNVPAGLKDVVAVSAGEYSSLVLKQDGTIFAWGSYGYNPTGLRDVIAIAAGSSVYVALRSDGTVATWSSGTLTSSADLPAGLTDVVAIAAGRNHQLALKADGTVIAWGANSGAVVPAGLTDVVAISAGYDLSVALKANGSVVAWGQYADSTPTGLRALDCGDGYTIAQRTDGSLIGWGFAPYSNETAIPTDLGTVRAFSAGYDHVVVLRDASADAAPELTAEPVPASVNAGVDYTFSVAATGVGPLSYQWLKNGQPIAGATASTLTINDVSAADVAGYSVRVSNHAGSRLSAAAALTLLAPPSITARPARRVAAALGQPVVLSATAVGAAPSAGALSYQWKKNNLPIPGATSATCTLASFTFADAGAYTLEVTDALGAIARVTSFVLPGNVATQIRMWGTGASAPPATLTNAVKVKLSRSQSGGGLALRADGKLENWGSDRLEPPVGLDRVVDIAVGDSGQAIALRDDQSIITFGNNVTGTPPAIIKDAVLVGATSGTFYALCSDGRVIAWPTYQSSSSSISRLSGMSDVVALSSDRTLVTALTKSGVALVRTSNGTATNSADFRHAIAVASGEAHTLGLTPSGTVTCWSRGYDYGASTIPADIGLAAAIAAGRYSSFVVKADGTMRAWGSNEYGLTTIPSDLANVVAFSAADYAVAALRLTDSDSAPTITASPVSVAVGLDATFTLSVTATGTGPLSYQWRRNGIALSGAVGSSYPVASAKVDDAGVYDVVVTNHRGSATSASATVTVAAPPSIDTAPTQRVVVNPGQPVSLSVTVSSTAGPVTYRWKKNNRVIAGATGASYALASATFADAGAYTVEVADAAGRTSRRTSFVVVTPTKMQFIHFGDTGSYNVSTLPATITGPLLSVIPFGTSSNVALKADGTVVWWGNPPSSLATPPAGLAGVVALSTDGNYALALKSDGTVTAWGSGPSVPTGLSDIIAVAVGNQQSLALKSDGTVAAWGRTDGDYATPASLRDIVSIHAYSGYAFAVKSDGNVVGWGSAGSSQISGLPVGQGITKAWGSYYVALGLRSDATLVGWGSSSYYGQLNIPAGLSGVTDVALSYYHALALKSDGTVTAWGTAYSSGALSVPAGLNRAYAIGVSDYRSIILRDASADTTPTITAQPQAISAAEGGGTATFTVVATGPGPLTYQWRRNGTPLAGANSASLALSPITPAQAGSYDVVVSNHVGSITSAAATFTVRGLPVVTAQSERRIAVAPGGSAQFSVTATGTGTLTYQWRRNGVPLVGETAPTLSLSNLTRADAGWYVCAITDDNGTRLAPPQWLIVAPARTQVLAWGANSSGQTSVPTGITDAVAVAAGSGHSLVLRRDGSFKGWGNSSYLPAASSGIAGVVAISGGGSSTYTVHSDGSLRRWGGYSSSNLSIPAGEPVVALSVSGGLNVALRADGSAINWNYDNSSANLAPAEAVNLSAVAAAYSFNVGLKTDSTLVQWGSASQSIPAGLTSVRAIAAGYSHALALKSDGTVVAWGDNSSGQTTVPAGLADVVAISATGYASFALKSDGSVVSWGRNTEGERNVPATAANVFALASASPASHMLALRDVSADSAPTLTTAPVALVAAVGERATLSVVATGPGPFTYVWRKNGAVLTGVTGSVLAFDPVTLTDAGSYTVEVANHVGSVVSAAASVTVEAAPTFTLRPTASVTGTPGSALTLTGAATSSYLPITYQWNKDNRPITGATSATFTLPSFANADSGAYTLVATDAHGHKIYATSFVLPSYGPVQVLSLNGYYPPPANLGAVIDISGGSSTNLALRPDRTLATWGGGLSALPVANDFVRIASTNSHGLALHSDGTIAGFGYGNYGEITIPARADNVVAVATGTYHSLALRADGSVIAWGRNDYQQCDVPADLANVVAVAASGNLSAAVKADGTVVVWGDATSKVTSVPAGLSGVIAVALGTSHALALKSDGTVVAWGNNSYGQANVPSGLTGIVEISASSYTSAARSAASVISVWGSSSSSNNTSGLGTVFALRSDGDSLLVLRDASTDTVPVISSQPASVTVAAGTYSTNFSVSATGTGPFSYQWRFNGTPISGATAANYYVYNLGATNVGSYDVVVSNHVGSVTSNAATLTITGSGSGSSPVIAAPAAARIVGTLGQPLTLSLNATGTGTLTYQWFRYNRPIAGATSSTLTLPSFTRANAGAYTLAVTDAANGTTSRRTLFVLPPVVSSFIIGAGDDSFGQASPPVSLTDAVAVASGELHSLALRADGMVSAWGANLQNQATVPSTLSDVVAIAAGAYHSLALRADGTVTGWGSSYSNVVSGGSSYRNLIALAAGANISVALRDDGSVATWSNNYYSAPTLANAVAIAAGSDHGLALKLDGTVAAWGSTTYGQTTVPAGLTGVTSIASGYNHNLALKSDGTIVAWGRNQSSQLNVPASASAYVAVRAGGDWSAAQTTDGNWHVWGDPSPTSPVVLTNLTAAPFAESWGAHHSLRLYDLADFTLPIFTRHPQSETVAIGGSLALSATAVGPGPLSYQWLLDGAPIADTATRTGTQTATLHLANVTPSAAGNYVLLVTNDSGSAASLTAVVTIKPNAQTITFAALPACTYTAAPIALEATASSGLPVSFEIVSGQAILTGGQLTLTGVGTVVVRATQSGDGTYAPATPVDRSFTVGRATAEITLANLVHSYSGAARSATAVTSPAGLSVAITYEGRGIPPSATGVYSVYAVIDDPRYSGTAFATLEIMGSAQSITFQALADRAFPAAPVPLSASASSGLPVTYTLVSGPARLAGGQLVIVGPGVVTVRASQSGDANYYAAPDVERSFDVVTGLSNWSDVYFSAEEQADPAISGPNADPDGDGIPNLVEYALGMDPRRTASTGLPVATQEAGSWTYTFTKPADRSDVGYSVVWSSNLTIWSDGTTLTRISSVDGMETWQATYPAASAPNCFFRLVVTH